MASDGEYATDVYEGTYNVVRSVGEKQNYNDQGHCHPMPVDGVDTQCRDGCVSMSGHRRIWVVEPEGKRTAYRPPE